MCALAHWPSSERPRERLLAQGPAALSDAELLALVLGGSARGCGGVVEASRALLKRIGGLGRLSSARVPELLRLTGVGPARACALVAIFELARRTAEQATDRGQPLASADVVYARLAPRLSPLLQETFVVLALDVRNRLISVTQVAQGTATSVEVHPREVFAPAIRDGAAFVIVAHNHPSGDPTPSTLDQRLTERLREAGQTLGIPLLDHVIIGRSGYVSLGTACAQ